MLECISEKTAPGLVDYEIAVPRPSEWSSPPFHAVANFYESRSDWVTIRHLWRERKFHHLKSLGFSPSAQLRNFTFRLAQFKFQSSYLLLKVHSSSSVLHNPSSNGSVHSAGDKLWRFVTFFNSLGAKMPKVDEIDTQNVTQSISWKCILKLFALRQFVSALNLFQLRLHRSSRFHRHRMNETIFAHIYMHKR